MTIPLGGLKQGEKFLCYLAYPVPRLTLAASQMSCQSIPVRSRPDNTPATNIV